MANANLNLSGDLLSGFSSALASGNDIRFIVVRVLGESLCIAENGLISKVSTIESDFKTILLPALASDHASLVLICLNDDSLFNFPSSEGRKEWCLYSYIPSSSPVKEKMLAASSVSHLKNTLGSAYWKYPDIQAECDTDNDQKWIDFMNSTSNKSHVNTQDKEILMSEKEKVLAEEALALSETIDSRMSGVKGSLIPFKVQSAFKQALLKFKSEEINFTEINLENEEILFVSSITIDANTRQIAKQISTTKEARYVLVTLCSSSAAEKKTIFIYSCPEEENVRRKMTMASGKASVIALINNEGISIDASCETRDLDDLDEEIKTIMNDGGEKESEVETSKASRPTRPGGGKRTVKKFVADDL